MTGPLGPRSVVIVGGGGGPLTVREICQRRRGLGGAAVGPADPLMRDRMCAAPGPASGGRGSCGRRDFSGSGENT